MYTLYIAMYGTTTGCQTCDGPSRVLFSTRCTFHTLHNIACWNNFDKFPSSDPAPAPCVDPDVWPLCQTIQFNVHKLSLLLVIQIIVSAGISRSLWNWTSANLIETRYKLMKLYLIFHFGNDYINFRRVTRRTQRPQEQPGPPEPDLSTAVW